MLTRDDFGKKVTALLTSQAGVIARQRRWCVLLACGPAAAWAGRTVLEIHGVTGWESEAVHVAVPHKRSGAGPAGAAEADAHAILCGAEQQGKVSVERLSEELLVLTKLPRRAMLRESLADIGGGAQSMNEIAFRRLVRRAGLPQPKLHIGVATEHRRAFVDGGGPDAGIWFEIDGELHREAATWIDDLDRAKRTRDRPGRRTPALAGFRRAAPARAGRRLDNSRFRSRAQSGLGDLAVWQAVSRGSRISVRDEGRSSRAGGCVNLDHRGHRQRRATVAPGR